MRDLQTIRLNNARLVPTHILQSDLNNPLMSEDWKATARRVLKEREERTNE